ncbi:MAG: transporter substrate-binding domain-containing protein [Geminicoccaceae bacterium]
MSSAAVRIGLLFSTSGPYRTIGRAMLNGALLALEQVNRDPACPFVLEPVIRDPGGCNGRYAELARAMLADEQLVHIVGCYTSSSRKEVLPFFEKYDGLLWYPSHYEGFESSENVIYTGAAPNQHIVPLADYLLRKFGKTAYFVGSNYIWAWENNKIMREAVQDAGGHVIAERYLPVSEVDVADIVAQVLDSRPSFVFNTLIGDSAYAFFRLIRQSAAARHIDQPKVVPIASCSLAEPELVEIGAAACDGHISASVYFESVTGGTNQRFVEDYRARFPHSGPTSADVEASYIAVQLLGRALRRAGRTDMVAVRAAVLGAALQAPQGRVHIDRDNRHCYLTPRIAISTRDYGFDIIYEADGPVKPDPYLVWSEWQKPASRLPHLRVVT